MAYRMAFLALLIAGLWSIKIAVILIAISTFWSIKIKDSNSIAQTMIIWLTICAFYFISPESQGHAGLAVVGAVLGAIIYGTLYLYFEGKQKPRV